MQAREETTRLILKVIEKKFNCTKEEAKEKMQEFSKQDINLLDIKA